MPRHERPSSARAGFTLIELLAALAIGAVIIAAVGALVNNVALNFDRGTRTVSDGERLILAVERLAADIGAARFVVMPGERGPTAAFIGEAASASGGAKVVFIGPGGIGSNPKGEEVVGLAVEQEDDVARLVRRSAAWPGPRTRIENVSLADPVILLEGKVLISVSFARFKDGALVWSDAWKGEPELPRFVRLAVRAAATGADVIAATDFVIRADASAACGQPGCGSGAAPSGAAGQTGPAGQKSRKE
jgi:prepilin-type N-terminal cleavage/methylation domain-containing protein